MIITHKIAKIMNLLAILKTIDVTEVKSREILSFHPMYQAIEGIFFISDLGGEEVQNIVRCTCLSTQYLPLNLLRSLLKFLNSLKTSRIGQSSKMPIDVSLQMAIGLV